MTAWRKTVTLQERTVYDETDYTIDWTDWLAGAGIASAVVTSTDATVQTYTIVGNTVEVRLTNGTAGTQSIVTCAVTTNEGTPRTAERSFAVNTTAPQIDRPALFDERVGFGASTTGGFGYPVIYVTNTLNDHSDGSLRKALDIAALNGGGYIRITVSGTLAQTHNIHLTNNVTIDGSGVNFIIDGIGGLKAYDITDSQPITNWIVYNITIRASGTNAAIVGRYSPDRFWIHHCTIEGGTDDTVAIDRSVDGNITYGTVSWCRWNTVVKAGLYTDLDLSTQHIFVTLHHNYYNGCGQRLPQAANATLHCYNNVINDWTVAATAAPSHAGGLVLHENSFFDAHTLGLTTAYIGSLTPPDSPLLQGAVKGTGNVLDEGTYTATGTDTDAGRVPDFTTYYTYSAETADATMKTNVINNAGVI